MKNIFLLCVTLFYSVFANNCYTENDVLNSDKLFSYKDSVYDITGYNHPGGKSDLLKTVSLDASVFFNQSQYKFHIGSSRVKNDLKKMFVGQLYNDCTNFTSVETTTMPDMTTESSITVKSTKHKKTTTEILTTLPTISPVTNYTTNIPNTTIAIITTNTPCTTTEKENIENNSSSNNLLKTNIKFSLVIFLIYTLL
jgi:hypothetical protein